MNKTSLPGKTACIGENANTAKGDPQQKLRWGNLKRLSRESKGMRSYRILGNKLGKI
jgi:hypothetical protein